MSDHDRSSAQNSGRKNHKIERFIERLLSAPSVESAAAAVGISFRTAWRWMRDPAVIARLGQLRRQSMMHAMSRLQTVANLSVTTLKEVQEEGDSESARVSAARCILEMALRATEIGDIEERLAKLEELVRTRGWRGSVEEQPHAAPRDVNGHA